MSGKPRDPDYWRKWRAAHPAYRSRERVRMAARDRTGRDRSQEKRPSRAIAPVPVLYATLVRGTRLSFWEDELRMDLAQEAELARLEGRDPVESCRMYRTREMAWRAFTMPLLEGLAA